MLLCEVRGHTMTPPEGLTGQGSNSFVESCDCRMIDFNVPSLISLWLGTGTVTVEESVFFCMIMWLLRCRTL